MSISEKRLWQAIRGRKLGYVFKTQVPIGEYTLDFYCPAAGLCIEVDGPHHETRRPYDAKRDAFLASRDILTIRVPSGDLFEYEGIKFANWIDAIQRSCDERTSERKSGALHP